MLNKYKMLLLGLKKCVFYTQMRQLVTLNTCNKNHTKMKGSLYCVELKYHSFKNPNLSMYKLFHSNSEQKEINLPPLMWYPRERNPSIIKVFFSFIFIRWTIDKDFRLSNFIAGASQAISVVSKALSTQNYEALNDLVDKKTCKILKHRVDHLTTEQRKLIATKPINSMFGPTNIQKLKTTDKDEIIIRITVAGIYSPDNSVNKTFQFGPFTAMPNSILTYIYIFQRRYRKGIGGSWMVILANHESKGIHYGIQQ